MENLKEFSRLFGIALLFLILSSCSHNRQPGLPELATETVTEITLTTAKSGGTIMYDGGAAVSVKGICWATKTKPTIMDSDTSNGSGNDVFKCTLTKLTPGEDYFVRAFATNLVGTAYGDEKIFRTLNSNSTGQIIADHTIVDRFDDIPQEYINKVKETWLVYAGESHSSAIRTGLTLLEASDSKYQVNVTESGTPQSYTNQYLRASRATWGDYSRSEGWIYGYGEEDWFTNSTAINRTKAGITYCNEHSLEIAAIGFGWCWDHVNYSKSSTADPVYGCRWSGTTVNGPSGALPWGLDAGDNSITGNTVNMDTYLSVTQQYIDYCITNGYKTKVFFTTAPVDTYFTGEDGYQGHLKHEHIRNYVKSDVTRILFDYADILCYDDNGIQTTTTWNGHVYPTITKSNLGDGSIGHIGSAGAKRLAKAMWWMLARITGWDGN